MIKGLASVGIPGSRHFRLAELARGVHAAIAVDGGWAICNSGVVEMNDETLIFDTFVNQEAASELRSAAELLTGKPVRTVVNSHWHSDHIKGNQAFPDARIVSTAKTVEVMEGIQKRYQTDLQAIRDGLEKDLQSILAGPEDADKALNEGYRRGHLEGLPTFRYTLPGVTFDGRMALDGRRGAEAVTYGGGHTVSDVLLHLPEERVVFLGDLLFIDYQPYLADGNPEELLRILDKVESLDAKVLVPGHGPVGGPKDIQPVRDYVMALMRVAGEVKQSGGSAEDAVKRPVPPPYDTWKWRSFYKDNVEFLFQRGSGAA